MENTDPGRLDDTEENHVGVKFIVPNTTSRPNGWDILYILLTMTNYLNIFIQERKTQGDPVVALVVAIIQWVFCALVLFTRKGVRVLFTCLVPEVAWLTISLFLDQANVVGSLSMLGILGGCILVKHLAFTISKKEFPSVLAASIFISFIPLLASIIGASHVLLNFLGLPSIACGAALVLLHVIFRRIIATEKIIYNPVLTHHLIEERDHTIPTIIGNLGFFTCTRCTGMLVGVGFSVYFLSTLGIRFDPLVALVADVFVPIPVFVDWGTQRLGLRTSSTLSRLITGALTGFGFYLLTFAMKDYPVISGVVLGTYFVIFFLLYYFGTKSTG